MPVFDHADFDRHEEVEYVHDPETGLRAIVAVHNTRLGPALGGCRMYPYRQEEDALRDVLRLSRGMSYKAALAGVALGGGKCVVIGDPAQHKTPELLRALGRFIDRLGGRYIVGEDLGTSPADMRILKSTTSYVCCVAESDGGYGDPAPMTALGVLEAIKAGLEATAGTAELRGRRVAVQGFGNVGANLCRQLLHEAASVIACDPTPARAEAARRMGVEVVPPADIYSVAADVFAPCAVGAVLHDESVAALQVRLVAGAANNQLGEDRHAEQLHERGILYVPDYVANGGGLIACAAEWYRTPRTKVHGDVVRIRATCTDVLSEARSLGVTPLRVANRRAEERLVGAGSAAALKYPRKSAVGRPMETL